MNSNTHIKEEQMKKMLCGELSIYEASRIQEHIADCTYCAEIFAQMVNHGYLVAPPPDMKEKILKKSRTFKKRRTCSKKMQLCFYSLRVGVAMCFALFFLFSADTGWKDFIMPKEKPFLGLETLTNVNRNINEITTKIVKMEVMEHDTQKE